MRIDDNFTASSDLRGLQHVDRTPEAQLDETRRTGRGGSRDGDTASISSLGAELSRAWAKDAPEEIQRVAAAQRAYESGQMTASAEETAESLISAALTDGLSLGERGLF